MNTAILSRLLGREYSLQEPPLTMQYPGDIVTREVVKSGAGLAICLGILIFMQPISVVAWVIGIFGAMFAYYLVQQATRYNLRYVLEDGGLKRESGSRSRTLRWEELAELKLGFYPHGRRAQSGTLVLTLKNGKEKLKVDSNLDHFPSLLQIAAYEARQRDVLLNPTTQDNLEKLGL